MSAFVVDKVGTYKSRDGCIVYVTDVDRGYEPLCVGGIRFEHDGNRRKAAYMRGGWFYGPEAPHPFDIVEFVAKDTE